ncbi:NDR1/HIN1-like protein 12 [Mercurialis annua]|uniref:NDR1/HIN1-like protein 12 n=1 Tax=Mercurialis annua TaxID=3986 RepID=UPI002161087D|nr:NDR1/HIN1-like protein 12 [Mercurialis annua]
MPKLKKHHDPQKTSLFWWLVAILCSILTIAVIIVGIIVFVGYLVIHPRIPIISVVNAHLDHFQYDLAGILVTQVTIIVRSENDNTKAHASFSGMNLTLFFDGIAIAHLVAGAYEVRKNDTKDFNYVATSTPIPLDPSQMKDIDVFLNEDEVRFDLKGNARARWRVGPLGSVRFQCHLNCQLKFHISNGTYIPKRCTSKAK